MKLTHWLTLWKSDWQPAFETTGEAAFSGFSRFLKRPSGQLRFLHHQRTRQPYKTARSQLPTTRSPRPAS